MDGPVVYFGQSPNPVYSRIFCCPYNRLSGRGSLIMPVCLGDWLTWAAMRLADERLADERGEYSLAEAVHAVRLATMQRLSISKTQVLAHPEMPLTVQQLTLLEEALALLMRGEALPYVLGEWEFYGRLFTVTPYVLIPRPETELMIEKALVWAKDRPVQPIRAADVGTGSGCIAVTLALELPDAEITAVDISPTALQVAKANGNRHDVQHRVHAVQGDLLSAFAPHSFDLICANLPYIPSERLADLAVARREPRLALDGGPDGLALIGRLLPQVKRLLKPGGLALLEIDDTHEDRALALGRQYFPDQAEILRDYQDKPRMLKVSTGG